MRIPEIKGSTRDERREFVVNEWRCKHSCEMCCNCAILRGRDAEILYADYIEGQRDYMDITFELRNRLY